MQGWHRGWWHRVPLIVPAVVPPAPGASRRTGGSWQSLPQLHLRCRWSAADGLEGVQRRSGNTTEELQGRICTATLKGRRDGDENKRSSTPRLNLGLRQS